MTDRVADPSTPLLPGPKPGPAGTAPMVSVAMITYNHERFIREAIDSVLNQQTNFTVELVIGEDCSKDNTRQIVLDYQSRYPGRVRVLAPEINLGVQRNFMETLRACTGKYIALLEGDDWWTDSNKLQKQVDFLEAHPDYAATSHNAMRFSELTKQDDAPCCVATPERLRMADFLPMNQVPTCSVVFRNGLIDHFPAWFASLPACDWVLHILTTRVGDMAYDGTIMARYRIHANGLWSGKSRAAQLAADVVIYGHLLSELGSTWAKPIRLQMSRRILHLMYQQEKDGDVTGARDSLLKYVRFNRLDPRTLRPAVCLAAGRLFTPRCYRMALKVKNAIFQLLRAKRTST